MISPLSDGILMVDREFRGCVLRLSICTSSSSFTIFISDSVCCSPLALLTMSLVSETRAWFPSSSIGLSWFSFYVFGLPLAFFTFTFYTCCVPTAPIAALYSQFYSTSLVIRSFGFLIPNSYSCFSKKSSSQNLFIISGLRQNAN